jgi:hypothetical protein
MPVSFHTLVVFSFVISNVVIVDVMYNSCCGNILLKYKPYTFIIILCTVKTHKK